jgi:hypothetical protein
LEQVKFAAGSWQDWRKRGKDTQSVYADPKFANPEKGDFTMADDSPAWALGFKPIDMSMVGPRRGISRGGRVPQMP